MARKTVIDKAIDRLEAEIEPLQLEIDMRKAAISKLREQAVKVAVRKRVVPIETAAGFTGVAESAGHK